MKELYDIAHHIVWITQFGLSVAAPLVLCILAAVILDRRFALGGWIIAAGVVLGVAGAVGGLRCSLKLMERQGRDRSDRLPPPVSFNRH